MRLLTCSGKIPICLEVVSDSSAVSCIPDGEWYDIVHVSGICLKMSHWPEFFEVSTNSAFAISFHCASERCGLPVAVISGRMSVISPKRSSLRPLPQSMSSYSFQRLWRQISITRNLQIVCQQSCTVYRHGERLHLSLTRTMSLAQPFALVSSLRGFRLQSAGLHQ